MLSISAVVNEEEKAKEEAIKKTIIAVVNIAVNRLELIILFFTLKAYILRASLGLFYP